MINAINNIINKQLGKVYLMRPQDDSDSESDLESGLSSLAGIDAVKSKEPSLSRENLIKQCVAMDLALERIEAQKQLNKLSWNDWNLFFFKWSFSGKKELLDKIDHHLIEIKKLESNKSLNDLQEENQLSTLATQKIQEYQSSKELSNTHAKLCEDYYHTLFHQCPRKPPTSINYTDEIGEEMGRFEEKLDSYVEPGTFREADHVKYVLDNKISDDLGMIDTFFKVRDGDLGKYLGTIPLIKFLIYIAENFHNYFTPNATKNTLNESETLTEPVGVVLNTGEHLHQA